MQRIAVRLYPILTLALLSGCSTQSHSQTGSASVSFKGLICIGCNATTRNTIMPSADEALSVGILLLAALIVCAFWYAYLKFKS